MPYQEQYQLFRKALFNTLSREEESQLEEARKDPVFDKDFREYLETSSSILRVEEKAAAGREDELAFQYAEQKTNTGENLYVEFRMRHDEEYAQLVADAREFIAGLQEQETSVSQPVVMNAVASDSEPPQQEKLEAAQIPQELPGNMAQTTATVRRLIPRKTRWYGGVAVAIILAVLAGWFTRGNGPETSPAKGQFADSFFFSSVLTGGNFSSDQAAFEAIKDEVRQLLAENKYKEAEQLLDTTLNRETTLKKDDRERLLKLQLSIVVKQGLEKPVRREKALSLIDRQLAITLSGIDKNNERLIGLIKSRAAFSRIVIQSYNSTMQADHISALERMRNEPALQGENILKDVNKFLQILKEE